MNSIDPTPIVQLFSDDENEYILEIRKYVNINSLENNLFNYKLSGIKIINITEIINNGMEITDSSGNIINENDIISYEDNIKIKKSINSGVSFGNYIFMFAGIILEPSYDELIKYIDDSLEYSNVNNNQIYNLFYEPQTLVGRTSFFNFSIEYCYKTCSECNNLLGNSNNNYCTNCSDEYPYQYLNGEKCVSSCKDINLFQYKTMCLNSCKNNTFVDELSFICYDNCKDNDNSSRIITLNNVCIDKCPDGYILNEEEYICDKIAIESITTYLIEDISTFMEITTNDIKQIESSVFQEVNNKESNLEIRTTIIKEDRTEELTNNINLEETITPQKILSTIIIHDMENIITNEEYIPEEKTDKENNEENDIEQQKSIITIVQEISTLKENNEEQTQKMDLSHIFDNKQKTDIINDGKFENDNQAKEKGSEENNFILSDTLLKYIIIEDEIEYNEKSNSINQNNYLDHNCHNLFYYDDNNEINCLSNNENICPEDYPYKSLNSNECQKYFLKYKNNWVNSIPNGTCIDTQFSNLDICIDTNAIIEELGGFCIINKTNIIFNIKKISESDNNRMELCEGLTFFFYTNKDDIYKLSQKYQNLTFVNIDKCTNNLIKYYNYPVDTIFYIIGIDSPNKLSSSSINNYQYFVYNENGTEMDTKNLCSQSDIIMSSPIIKKDLINYNISYELYKQGYDIYNLTSKFYSDDCTPANINKMDIGFYKRLEDFYPYNISLCLDNCTYKNVDYNLSRLICSCIVDNNKQENNKDFIATEENFFK